MPTCLNCQKQFAITEKDLNFYKKASPTINQKTYLIPPPTLCPSCRQQRRLSHRNEVNLYNAKCAKTGKQIISMYEPSTQFKIYEQDEWWKDDWDPIQYGQEFDFSRPFFDQFQELRLKVPRMSLNCIDNENSYYTNYALRNKNSYLITTADYNEDCYYGRFSQRNYRCLDFDFSYESRILYQAIDVHKSEHCIWCQKTENSSECYFCYDMKGCHNCIFCAGLRNQTYKIFNKKVTTEEFENFKKELKLNTKSGMKEALKKGREFWQTIPHKQLETIQCEDCIGDYLKNSKNAEFCFDSKDLHDVKFGSFLEKAKDSYDWDFFGHGEVCYEMANCAYRLFECRFCMNTWEGNSNCTYCDLCLGNTNLFGCVGLRKKKYCILNKQYTEEEYEKLVPKIIEHMTKTGEWGEFLPAKFSTFAYNDSVAFEYYPKAEGLRFREENKKEYLEQKINVADDINNIPEDITKEILACGTCKKNFKITDQELKFYKEFQLALPENCWLCRHHERMSMRNPRIIYERICDKCKASVKTTYSPNHPEKIYCEKCYLNEMA